MNKVILDVKDILGEVGAEEHYSFQRDFTPIETETTKIEFAEPVTFDIKVENTGSGVRVKGHIKSALILVCSRCLNKFSFPVDWEVDELFSTERLPKEETYTVEDSKIDLGPPTEEEFVLAIPIKPLCREACQGICPVCGQPINEKHKPHEEVKIDKRLEVLKELLKEKEGE
ncbi:MAG TPA: YceD family protein [Anaerolineae bacterium]|jgi:uncharacterized protein|nr:YceD family protein [Anaerolineae bacterium]